MTRRIVQETQELLEQSLVAFDEEVACVDESEKKDLMDAERKCPELLDAAFKLQFLRTDLFDVRLAARRYILHWKNKVELFGPEKAFLPMTLDGAMKDDIDMLSKGYVRLIPGQERVIFFDQTKFCKKTDDVYSLTRCVWYIQGKALQESEEMQKIGAVLVWDFGHRIDHLSKDLAGCLKQAMTDAFPLRFQQLAAMNVPYAARGLYHVFKLFLKPAMRGRLKMYGNDISKLEKKCGIEIDTQNLLMDDQEQWIRHTRQVEASCC